MKELNLSLTITADGKAAITALNQVDNSIHKCITQTETLSKYFYLLQNAIVSFKGTVGTLRAVFNLTDEIKQTEARLRIATGTQLQFNQALKESQQIAKNARVDFLSTVNLFSRLSTAAKQYGIEQSKIGKVTEAVTYGLKLYGASTAEVASVQTQLSQALASGTLAGDEFKSMAEASPRLMQALAEGLGVARSALKKMASDGKLTTKIVVDALAKQSEKLKQEFTHMPLTVSEAVGQIKNSIVQLAKDIDQSTNFSQKVSQGLLVINAHLKEIIKVAIQISSVFISMWVANKIIIYTRALSGLLKMTRMMTLAQTALNLAMRANPISLVITALGTAISFIELFGDSITPVTGKMATLKDYALVVWDVIIDGVKKVGQVFSWLGTKISSTFNRFSKGFPQVTGAMEKLSKISKSIINHWIGLYVGAFEAIKKLFQQLPTFIEKIMIKATNAVLSHINFLMKKSAEILNHLPGINIPLNQSGFKLLEEKGQQTALNLSATFSEAFNKDYLGNFTTQIEGLGKKVAMTWQNRAEQKHQEQQENNPTNDAQVESLSKLATQATLTKEALKELQKVKDFKKNQETNLADYAFETSLIGQQADVIEKLRFEYELSKQAKEAMIGMSERNKAAIEAEVQAIKEKYQALTQQRQSVQSKQDNDALGGMKAGLKDVGVSAGTMFNTMKQASSHAMSSMADGIANMVVSGKANFKELTKSILADIAKMLIKFALLKAVQTAMSAFANGGSFDNSGQMALAKGGAFNAQGVKYYARGDIFNSPTMFAHAGGLGVMGEAGPEAVMPLTRGPNGKLGVKLYNEQKRQALAGQVNNIEITVNVADGKTESAQKSTQESRQLAEKLQMAVRQVLSQEMRPGGMLAAR